MMQDTESFIGTVIGGYRLERLIGTGGNGAVFLGKQIDSPHDEAAIKILVPQALLSDAQRAEQRTRFVREANTLSKQLRHERILPVLVSGEDTNTNVAYMILPYMRNGTLASRLGDGQLLPLADVARYITQIAEALDYAHQHQPPVIHRDIKPSNVLLDDRGQAVLADFGIAKLLDSDSTTQTSAGGIIGTAEYMSPEQAQGKPVGPASDIYGLGMLTYHLVTGQLPFPKTPAAVSTLVNTVTMPPTPPVRYRPDLPMPAEVAILRALDKDPANRFPSAGAFANAFSLGVQGKSPAEITDSPTAAFVVPPTTFHTPVAEVTAPPVLQMQPPAYQSPAVTAPPAQAPQSQPQPIYQPQPTYQPQPGQQPIQSQPQPYPLPASVQQPVVPPPPGNMQPNVATLQPMPPAMKQQSVAMPVPTSGWAIASLVCSIVGGGVLGVIFGFVALNEINKSGGRIKGSGMAKAGIIIGFIVTACACAYFIIAIAATASQGGT